LTVAALKESTERPGDPSSIYWDWNATTPPHPDVVAAVQSALEQSWGNPSSQHRAGRAARALVEGVRERIGQLLGVHSRDVLFVGSGTEANNLALNDARGLVVSRLDHPSIVRFAEAREAQGLPVVWVPVPEQGRLLPATVAQCVAALPVELRTRSIVSVTAVNHETGVLQDVAGIAEGVHALGARLHVDAAQALGKVPTALLSGADSWTVVAHKIRGPQGVAALGFRGAMPSPVLLGGSQERGLRPGTLSAPLIAGFGAALGRLDPERYASLTPLRDRLESALEAYALVNGASSPRAPHISSLSFARWSGERLVAALDVRGLSVSTGSACRVGTAEPSAVVAAMTGVERAKGAVRVSLGEDASLEQVERAIALWLPLLLSEA
jgi:cysteine desulfurase